VIFGNESTSFKHNSFAGCPYTPPVFDGFTLVEKTMFAVANSNVRAEPSTEAAVVEWLWVGDEVSVVGINEEIGWTMILINGRYLYVRSHLLGDENPLEEILEESDL
jgi:uncharacterized protein YgiM (DUF1202 family)